MNTDLFSINGKDVARGLVVAMLTGIALPTLAILQTPGFDVMAADWHQVLVVALNGAVAGFVSYLVKNFLSDSQGKVLGKIG